MNKIDNIPSDLNILKRPPKELYYRGDLSLLQTKKISIVGTRKPISYTKEMTTLLSQKFASIGYSIVSGAAMGVDAVAHRAAGKNTIAVMANSLDIVYPKVNSSLIENIYQNSLALSEYEPFTKATRYSFVVRNRIVVALGEALIITQADENSGTMRSAEIAHGLGKKIYVLPHRVGDSDGTMKLLKEKKAELIYDIDDFVSSFGTLESSNDKLLEFAKSSPTLAECIEKFGDLVYEYELEGLIKIENLKVMPL
jgi:DNA processing protein